MSQKFNWPQPGCVGLWHFNRNMNDSSGYGNNASGPDLTFQTAKFGFGAVLIGTSSYMDISDDASLHTTQFTVSVWYKGTAAGDNTIYSITSGYRGPTYYFHFGLSFDIHDGLLTIGTADSSYDFNYITGTEVVNDGEWHWCTATPGKVYVDGKLVGSGSDTTPGWYVTPNAVCIGARYKEGAVINTLTGLIDELMLLNYALTDNQIQRAYLFQVGAL